MRQQLDMNAASFSGKRKHTSKYEDVDATLFRWFKGMRAQNVLIGGPTLQAKGKCFANLTGYN